MKLKILSLLMVIPAVALFACSRVAPVYNVKMATVNTPSPNYTGADVERAILKAGTSLGWQMQKIKSGRIEGTLNVRRHMAQVNITYDKKNYNIEYKDSRVLKYDGTNIHKKYNAWIRNLDKHIRANLLNK